MSHSIMTCPFCRAPRAVNVLGKERNLECFACGMRMPVETYEAMYKRRLRLPAAV